MAVARDTEAPGHSPLDVRAALLLAAGLAVLTVAVYAPVRNHAWLNYDDDVYITRNPSIELGLGGDGLAWAFTTFHGANWFPLTNLSWMLDFELHGMDAQAFHLTGLGLHVLATMALFLALARMTGSLARSAFVAAVFAVHPLHVESVAWAAARKDPLSGLFFALALLAYAGSAGRPLSFARLAAVFLCLALGLLAKPVLVTLPFVLLLLDFWPLGRLRPSADAGTGWSQGTILRRAVVEKLPLFALVVAASAVTVMAQSSGGVIAEFERLPPGARVSNALVAYATYLVKAFWPSGLAAFYPHPAGALPTWQPILAVTLLAAVTALALARARHRPYLIVGWLWFIGTLVPMIGLVQVGAQSMADRYTYLPLIGLAIAVAWGVPDLWPMNRRALLATGGLAVGALLATTSMQLRHWRDSASLFEHTLRVTRDNHIAHAHLGSARLAQGRTAEAVGHFREAVRLRPGFMRVANNLAWILATSDDASVRDPSFAVVLAGRAAELTEYNDPAVLDTLAAAYAGSGDYRAARRTAQRGMGLARTTGQEALAEQIGRRLNLYRSNRPYRERPESADWY